MREIACIECPQGGPFDPHCLMCGGAGVIGVTDEDDDADAWIEAYPERPEFSEWVAAVEAIVGPLLADHGYRRVAHSVEPFYHRQLELRGHDPSVWNGVVFFRYDPSGGVGDYWSCAVEVYRLAGASLDLSRLYDRRPGYLCGEITYSEARMLPDYLEAIRQPYVPLGAEPPVRSRFAQPQAEWYYQTSAERDETLREIAKRLPAYLAWLADPAAPEQPALD